MTDQSDTFPVIIGVGQAVDRWDGMDLTGAPHPLAMIRTAIDRAVADTECAEVVYDLDLRLPEIYLDMTMVRIEGLLINRDFALTVTCFI